MLMLGKTQKALARNYGAGTQERQILGLCLLGNLICKRCRVLPPFGDMIEALHVAGPMVSNFEILSTQKSFLFFSAPPYRCWLYP